VQQKAAELLRPPAKTCCQGPRATRGTLLNFVDREVVVMELVEHGLVEFGLLRAQELQKIGAQTLYAQGPQESGSLKSVAGMLRPDRDEVLAQKVSLLEKLYLMVQLAEAVAWLHGEKRIIHKDLAPDNVMIHYAGDDGGISDWRGEQNRSPRELLTAVASFPRFSLKVIDFGLADKDELSRSWYEEQDVVASAIKMPYTSPEARRRKERINEPLDFQREESCFRVPRSLHSSYLSVLPGDLLADTSDARHDHDLEIVRVELDPATGNYLAYFRGEPAARAPSQQYELVRRLGEPHDVYAVGALFYYLLTGKHEEVDRLASLVNLLQQDQQRELTPFALRRDKYYQGRRNAIPEPLFRDELMMLILRAMVRGRPDSFVQSRIDRGAGPAQTLLRETQKLYAAVQRDLHAAPLRKQVLQTAAVAVPAVVIALLLLALRFC
jgi:serine/threonine protein kinase